MKKIYGLALLVALLPQPGYAYYTNDNFLTTPHAAPAWFTTDKTGGFFGVTTDGTSFTQQPITNALDIRLHKFQIDAAYYYISDRGIIYADSDLVALSVYFTLG